MLALATHAATRMDEIEGALARLDAAGAHGACMHGHQPIDPARLEALPRRRVLCVGCRGGAALPR
jgi:RNA polymerase-binding transcription factor DksA